MTISTKNFNEQTVRLLSQMNETAVSLQKQIATGQKDLSPSAAPTDVARLSAAEELEAKLGRFKSNLSTARSRLDMTDNALSQVQNLLTRAKELALQGANDTYSQVDRDAMRTEVDQIHDSLVAIANTKDTLGQSLFGGYRMQGTAFEVNLNGDVIYNGDIGQHRVQASETSTIPTSLDGANTFMRIESGEGPISIFQVLKGMSSALKDANNVETSVALSGKYGVKVDVIAGRTPIEQSFTLQGSSGAFLIEASVVDGAPNTLITAINAATSVTGITASDTGDGSLKLTDVAGGEIRITDYQVSGQVTAETQRKAEMIVSELDEQGNNTGQAHTIADRDQAINGSISLLTKSTEHMGNQLARVGSFANAADVQTKNLEEKNLLVQKSKSNITDADLAELISQLQTLLLNRDAAQQAFAKISQQSLFDYLR